MWNLRQKKWWMKELTKCPGPYGVGPQFELLLLKSSAPQLGRWNISPHTEATHIVSQTTLTGPHLEKHIQSSKIASFNIKFNTFLFHTILCQTLTSNLKLTVLFWPEHRVCQAEPGQLFSKLRQEIVSNKAHNSCQDVQHKAERRLQIQRKSTTWASRPFAVHFVVSDVSTQTATTSRS